MNTNTYTVGIYGIQDTNNSSTRTISHEHSIAIFKNGLLIHHAQLERLDRKKNSNEMPALLYELLKGKQLLNKELDFVLATEKNSSKSQFLYRASELLSFGLTNDSIDALSIFIADSNFINNTPHQANFLKIKISL